MSLETRELTPELWPAFEELFGKNGACGGCWCMSWRTGNGEKWADVKGALAKERMRELVSRGEAKGILAFSGKEPVGWCTFGKRLDFPKLARARSLACEDADRVWSLPCFFVRRGHRGQGIATALLSHALAALEKEGATLAESYPSKPYPEGQRTPDAFAWTGTRSLFEKAGFAIAGNEDGSKQRMRKELSKAPSRKRRKP
jgi:GNAT superfamily N-acetyltransferase